MIKGDMSSHIGIDLTRMECKEDMEKANYNTDLSIDLTRMECKVECIIWNNQPCWYRFNQNGM